MLAHLPFHRTPEQFDFGFQPSVDKRQICALDGPSMRFPLRLVLFMTGVFLLEMTSSCGTDTARSATPTTTASPALGTFESSVGAFVLLDSIGGGVGTQQKRVAVDDAVKPSGVFAFVILHVESVADSTVYVTDTDFRIVDEEGESYGISELATRAYVRSAIRATLKAGAQNQRSGVSNTDDLGALIMPTLAQEEISATAGAQGASSGPAPPMALEDVPLEFSENGYKMLYSNEPVPAGSELRIKAIYDIPYRAVDRRLKIRFRDEPPLDLPGAH